MKKILPNILILSIIILGAFLLFQIQAIYGKFLSPIFGGSASVWTINILFFQTFLFFGYLYAYLISKVNIKKQIFIHLFILFSSLFLTINIFLENNNLLLQKNVISQIDFFSPINSLIYILIITIGLQYFLLSTTSSLYQNWYHRLYNKEPYWLYKRGNFASVIALISYPIFEIFFSISSHGNFWGLLLIIMIFFQIIFIIFMYYRLKHSFSKNETLLQKNKIEKIKKEPFINIILWLIYSCIPVILLLSTGTKISMEHTSVPFLWVLILSIYLGSFILGFHKGLYSRKSYLPISIVIIFIYTINHFLNDISTFFIYLILLAYISFVCHGELFKLRPTPEKTTFYYLIISIGGIIGGIFVNIISPLIFSSIYEFYIALIIFIIFNIILFSKESKKVLNKLKNFELVLIIALFLIPIVAIYTIIYDLINENKDYSKKYRNFYGIIKISNIELKDKQGEKYNTKLLHNGNTIHGYQLENSKFINEATSYYGNTSGIGLVMKEYLSKKKNIGVIGLGAGTISSYGEKGDNIVFYDLNPITEKIAKNDFKYLKNTDANINIKIGDGRLLLKDEIENNNLHNYDILIIDAFSGDTIPISLLTKEALEIYSKKIKSDGVIAFHISNRYINLEPVVNSLGSIFDYKMLKVSNDKIEEKKFYESTSTRIILSKDEKKLENISNLNSHAIQIEKTNNNNYLWTDEYNNILYLLFKNFISML